MSLRDYEAASDKFEAEELDYGLGFPCCACKHQEKGTQIEPCRTCGHNICAEIETEPAARPSREEQP